MRPEDRGCKVQNPGTTAGGLTHVSLKGRAKGAPQVGGHFTQRSLNAEVHELSGVSQWTGSSQKRSCRRRCKELSSL